MQINPLHRIAIILLASLSLFSACVKDDDNDIVNPDDARDKYIGSWKCQETSQQFGNSTYTIVINKSSSDSSAILLFNFYQLGASFSAKINVNISGSANTLNIPVQTVSGTTIQGSGTFSNSTINLSYSANDGQINDNVTAVCTRTN